MAENNFVTARMPFIGPGMNYLDTRFKAVLNDSGSQFRTFLQNVASSTFDQALRFTCIRLQKL